MKNFLFSLLLLSSFSIFTMNNDQQLSPQPITLNSYLKNNKITPQLIGIYQKIWLYNKEKLLKEKKIQQDDNILYLVHYVTEPKSAEILTDPYALHIVKKIIIKDSLYESLCNKAETFTQLKKATEARALWSKCQFRAAEICKEKLEKLGIFLDIRQQKDEPYYDINFDIRKLDKTNEFFLLNNKNISDPLRVIPYIKAKLILTAITLQKANSILLRNK